MPNTINGTPRSETISGTTGDDEIFGQDGRDSIYGNNGNDIIHGGAGDRFGNQILDGGSGDDTVYGGDSKDTIYGGSNNDALYGGGGNDTIYGNAGDDTIDAGDGEDYVYDYEGVNTISLGAGDDYLEYVSYSNGPDTISGGAGIDEYSLFGNIATDSSNIADTITDFQTGVGGDRIKLNNVTGFFTGWDDTLNPFVTGHLRLIAADLDGDGQVDDTAMQIDRDGTAGGLAPVTMLRLLNVAPSAFTIDNFTRDGNYLGWAPAGGLNPVDGSVARVDSGASSLYGSSDADQFTGSWDNENIYGREGNDVINAAGGNDYIDAGTGHDTINAGAGNDTIYGQQGDDTINAGDGDDQAYGGQGNDTISMGDGDDYTYDYEGTNIIDAGAGSDRIQYVSYGTGADTITGGSDSDHFYVHLDRLAALAGNAVDTITDFQTGTGGDVIDLSGTGYFQGLPASTNPFTAGFLRLVQNGADTVLQGNRDGVGADWVDILILQNTTATNFAAGNFLWEGGQYLSPTGTGFTLTGARDSVPIYGQRDADTITMGDGGGQSYGQDGNDTIHGGAIGDSLNGGQGNDVLNGNGGNDNLSGDAGADTLNGGSGDDNLYGNSGDDTINAGDGNDYSYDYEGSNIFDMGAGDDTVEYVSYSSGVDQITLGAGRDQVRLYQTLIGNANNAADTINDFSAGVAGDYITFDNVVGYFQGWTNTTNPFATGYLQVVAGDIDADGVDDVLLQADANGATGGANFTTILNLRDVSLSALTGQNFYWAGSGGRYFDPFPGAANNIAPVQSSNFQMVLISGQNVTYQPDLGWTRDLVDADGDTLTATITTAPTAGVLTFNANGSVNFNASGVLSGVYNFTYTISDGTASVLRNGSINVLANNGVAFSFDGSEAGNTLSGAEGGDTLNGNGGNDNLYGNGGGDTLNGGDGNDYFLGGQNDDILNGGAGNDTFENDAGNETIDAGDGDDVVRDYTGGQTVNLGAGDDTVEWLGYNAQLDTVTGGTGRDRFMVHFGYAVLGADIVTDFQTGSGGDIIRIDGLGLFTNIDFARQNPFATGHMRLFQSGADTLYQIDVDGGGNAWTTVLTLQNTTATSFIAENFTINNQVGRAANIGWNPDGSANTINSGNFAEYVAGTNDADTINGDVNPLSDIGFGDDIRGYLGDDTINAGAGDDTVYAGRGNDTVNGGSGNDALYGEEGDDSIVAGAGDDTIYGGDGVDTIDAGSGDDTITGNAGNDIIVAGAGNDFVNDSEGGDTVDLGAGDDVISYVSYNSSLNVITGGTGSDTFRVETYYALYAGATADRITDFQAGPNGDLIYLQQFNNSYLTGWDTVTNPFTAGYIRFIAGDADGVGGANDTLLQMDRDGAGAGFGFVTVLNLLNIAPTALTRDNLLSDSFGQGLWWSPTGFGMTLDGSEGSDNNNYFAQLLGSFDADTINGNSGDDTISGLRGNDTLNGGGGGDTVYGNEGIDTLNGDDGDDYLNGNSGNDTVNGGAGNDNLYGEDGDDTLNGDAGDDYFDDTQGTNIFNGGAGADYFASMSNGSGLDTATGGTGVDQFYILPYAWYYSVAQGHGTADRIADFQGGAAGDILDLTSWSNGWLSGWDPNTNPVNGGYVRFIQGDGDSDGQNDDVLVQADRDGTGATYGFNTGVVLLNLDVDDLIATNVLFQGSRNWSLIGGDALPIALNDSYSTTEDVALTIPDGVQDVLNNDSDPEAQPITAVLDSGPANGTVTLNANGSFVYTPNANFTGVDSFTYRANDGVNNGNLATVTITVNPVNDAPVANPNSYNVDQDTTLTVPDGVTDVLSNDIDADGNPLTAILVTGATHGTVTLNANGSFVYTPTAGYSGTDSFTYKANDGTVDSAPTTVTITVNSSNVAPVGVADSYSVSEDGTLTVPDGGTDLLANDTDSNGDPITAGLVAGPSHGTLSLNANGSFVYTPNANFSGTDSFVYRPSDGTLNGNNTTVTITVNAVNDAPVADADGPYAANEDTTLNVNAANGVLAGDVDVDGNPLTAQLVSTTSNGTLVLNVDGSFTYTPNANFSGADSFVYRAFDGTTNSNNITVAINVAAQNDVPVSVNDSYTIGEDGVLTVGDGATDVLANDTDGDGDALTAVLVSGPANGTLSLNANGSFVYTPNANYFGSDSFTYRANDGTANGNVATVNITVTGSPDAPVAANNSFAATEDQPLVVALANSILNNDSDPDTDPLTAELLNPPANGTLTLNADGTFTYTPNANFNGTDSFTYRAFDGALYSSPATVFIHVAAVEDAPVAVDDAGLVADHNTTLIIPIASLIANDNDGDPELTQTLSITAVANPQHGTVVINGANIEFTPANGYSGPASFEYTLSDINGTDTGLVSLTVSGPGNSAPVGVADTFTGDEDVQITGNVLTNDTDANNDPLTASLITGPANGTLTLNADGSFTYTPNANFHGTDSFVYRPSDGAQNGGNTTVTLNVTSVNDVPVSDADGPYATNEDTTLNVSAAAGVLAGDTDADGDALVAELVSTTTRGTLTLNADGSFTYVPTANLNVSDSFTYRTFDGLAYSAPQTVTINVAAVNDAPVAVNDSYSVGEDGALTTGPLNHILSNDTDIDPDPLTAALVSGPANGTLTLNANGTFTYTPNANFSGTDTFTYRANDGDLDSNIATVTIIVNAVNDAPVTNADSYTVDEDNVLTIPAAGVLGNDTDVENDALNAVLVTGPAHGTLTLNGDGSFTYTPDENYNGADSFTYRANDGTADGNIATVNLTVNTVNDVPLAVQDGPYNATEDTLLVVNAASGLLSNDTDADTGAVLTANLVTGTSHGSLTLNPDGSFEYMPDANFNGVDSFVYFVADGASDSNYITVEINVGSVNDAPVAFDDTGLNAAHNTTLIIPIATLIGNDTDVDGNPLTITAVSNPANGTVVINGANIEFTPTNGYSGPASFDYTVSDGTASDTGSVSITVAAPGNVAPVAGNDSYSVNEDGTLNGASVIANDTDANGDALTASLVSTTANGTLTFNPDGTFTYTPNANFNGSDTFTYRVNDGSADSNIATVTITVNAVNDVPVTNADSYTVDEDNVLTIAAAGVLGNDTDVENDALNAVLVTGPAHGTLTLNADGSFTYTPDANYNGADSFSYRANDGTADGNIATVNLTVNAVNDVPVTNADSYSVDEDNALTIAAAGVLGNDTDVENDALNAVLVTGPAHGTLTLNADGSFTYTPDANYNGADSFTYRANDGTANGNIATVNLTVNAVNDNPDAVNDSGFSTAHNTALNIAAATLLANDTDGDPEIVQPLTITSVQGAVNGTVTLVGNTVTFTPTTGYSGAASFTYTISDGAGGSDTATVSLTVGAAPSGGATEGNDLLYGTPNSDTINALGGDDRVFGRASGDIIHGDGGNDQLYGEGGDDFLYGDDGNDVLRGADGNDQLFGGAGNDQLDGGTGNDKMTGGADNDTYIVDSTGDVVVELAGGGADTVRSTVTFGLSTNVERLELLGTANINGTGNTGDNVIIGNAGNNTLSGRAGNDSINGGDGNDIINGGDGNDTMNGGNGIDLVSYKDASGGVTVSLAITAWQTTGGSGNDRISAFENLEGSGFADFLTGDGGANKINGGIGADRITGAGGDDDLTGGADADIFVFSAAAANGNDTIRDFQTGVDMFEVRAADYGLTAGVLDAANFAVGAATAAHGQFVLGAYGALSWDADGTGAGVAVRIATVGSASLSHTDFMVV